MKYASEIWIREKMAMPVLRFLDEEGPVVLYALIDPRDRTVRYIGVTRNPARRFAQHRSGKVSNGLMRRWHAELEEAGLVCAVMILGWCQRQDWERAERQWIKAVKSAGFSLHNVHPGGRYENRNEKAMRERKAKRKAGSEASGRAQERQEKRRRARAAEQVPIAAALYSGRQVAKALGPALRQASAERWAAAEEAREAMVRRRASGGAVTDRKFALSF